MTTALRPMSVGELLDRSFFLYRKHFLLFVGIAALPHAVTLAFQLGGVVLRSQMAAGFLGWTLMWSLATMVCYLAVAAASQGATVMAVSNVHLDRPTSVAESFASIKGRIFYLSMIMIGVGIGISVGFILLIVPGIILACISLVVMPLLSRAKRRVGTELGSRAMKADARQTDFCVYLSAILLAGLVLNAALGWWWADPASALVMTPIIAKEGFEALKGESHCECS